MLGYNRVPNFEIDSEIGLTGSEFVFTESKLILGQKLGIQCYAHPTYEYISTSALRVYGN